MSRMDVLTNKELATVVDGSKLVEKYGEVIDRESAYEILNKKIEKAENLAKEEIENPSTSSRRSSSTRQNPVIKVVTSATFIRGVLGVLKKFMR